jgi:hypothetical protein
MQGAVTLFREWVAWAEECRATLMRKRYTGNLFLIGWAINSQMDQMIVFPASNRVGRFVQIHDPTLLDRQLPRIAKSSRILAGKYCTYNALWVVPKTKTFWSAKMFFGYLQQPSHIWNGVESARWSLHHILLIEWQRRSIIGITSGKTFSSSPMGGCRHHKRSRLLAILRLRNLVGTWGYRGVEFRTWEGGQAERYTLSVWVVDDRRRH